MIVFLAIFDVIDNDNGGFGLNIIELIVHAHLSAVAEDDASLVKHIGQSFRFSAVEVSSSSLMCN